MYWPLESTLAPRSGSNLNADLLPGQVVTQLVSAQNRTSRSLPTLQVTLQSLLQLGCLFSTPRTVTYSWRNIQKHKASPWCVHLGTQQNQCQYLHMWEKRFCKENTLRPIFVEIILQLLPWRFCNFTRECNSSLENLTVHPNMNNYNKKIEWYQLHSHLLSREFFSTTQNHNFN